MTGEAILVAEDIHKTYGGVQALQGVHFTARRGMVNVLVGENGAGKSTLMKILAGAETPSSGRILLDGHQVTLNSPRDAIGHGIAIIHQELSLFPNLDIAENLFAGRQLRRRTGLVDFAAQRTRAAALLARLGLRVDPQTVVGLLPIGQQQLVEIARALAENARILIMDEPTSALSSHEVDVLFGVIDELRRNDVTLIYISHKLDELRRIGDHVTVLRDGALVATAEMRHTDTAWIVTQMVGRSHDSLFVHQRRQTGQVLLEVDNLTATGPGGAVVVDRATLRVRAGEVVGIYGLMGAGRTELMECLMGVRPAIGGQIRVAGRQVDRLPVSGRLANGLALVPEDRQRDGLVQTLSVKDNALLAVLARLARRLLLAPRRERAVAGGQIDALRIKTASLDAPITSLSGGNQQKVVLARALLTKPTVLLLDEPTRGIDIGAKTEISRLMNELAGGGMGVLFVSSELTEVLAMADRVLVMASGRITAEFAADEATEQHLVAASASPTPVDVPPAAQVAAHRQDGQPQTPAPIAEPAPYPGTQPEVSP